MQWRRHAPSPGLPYRGARGELPVMATNPVHALVPDATIIKRRAGSHDGVRRAQKVVPWRKCPSYSLCWAPSRAALRTHTDLALENLALRQQLALPRRRSKRPQFALLDRLLWVWLSNQWAGWRDALHVVRPETAIRWHRQGFRAFWTWKSRRGRTGRPPIGSEIAQLVRGIGALSSVAPQRRDADVLRSRCLRTALTPRTPALQLKYSTRLEARFAGDTK